jgi:hypothetical protein
MKKSLMTAFLGLAFLTAGTAVADEGGHKCNCDKGAAAKDKGDGSGEGVKKASLTETHAQVKADPSAKKAEPAPEKKAPARKKVEEDPLYP